jgi:3-polyprenyl-4-hydroxybenzoate decarboxylase
MKAEKSLSSRLSRRNISVAGSAAHSVMAFILIVCACSSESLAASKRAHGMSSSMFQRTASSCLKSSG